MTLPPPLEQQAEDFAHEMTHLLTATVADDVDLQAHKVQLATPVFIVGNKLTIPDEITVSQITTMRGSAFPVAGVKRIYLRAYWSFIPNSSGRWLKAWGSDFQLRVGKRTPFIRLEVDPTKPEGSWLQVHVHITAESSLYGYLRGMQGDKRTRLDQLHLPVGGFRFRPCLEDFIEFAIDEGLIGGKDGWKDALETTRQRYLRNQFNAMVERHPDWAQQVLDRMAAGEEE